MHPNRIGKVCKLTTIAVYIKVTEITAHRENKSLAKSLNLLIFCHPSSFMYHG
jgi:hypothetical protein